VDLRPLITKDSIRDAIKHSHQESDTVATLVNLVVLQRLHHELDTILSAEEFLVISLLLTDTRQDVQGKFTEVQAALSLNVSNDSDQRLDEHGQLRLKHIELTKRLESVHHSLTSRFVVISHQEVSEGDVTAKLVDSWCSEVS